MTNKISRAERIKSWQNRWYEISYVVYSLVTPPNKTQEEFQVWSDSILHLMFILTQYCSWKSAGTSGYLANNITDKVREFGGQDKSSNWNRKKVRVFGLFELFSARTFYLIPIFWPKYKGNQIKSAMNFALAITFV